MRFLRIIMEGNDDMTLLIHELKMNRKTFLIWMVCLGFSCFGCILLFESLEESMGEMASAYAQMGTFSAALGLDRLSVATMEGFYATEVALMFAVGGAMFAAMTGAAIVAKEEEGHTAEFLHTLPFGRGRIIACKYAAMTVLILLFHICCIMWVIAGFGITGRFPSREKFVLYHCAQFVMQMEIGSLCFLLSACSKKKQIGAALGGAVLLYMMELMCRVVPDMEGLKYITPYYFSNAVDIFTEGSVDAGMLAAGIVVTAICAVASAAVYRQRDIA